MKDFYYFELVTNEVENDLKPEREGVSECVFPEWRRQTENSFQGKINILTAPRVLRHVMSYLFCPTGAESRHGQMAPMRVSTFLASFQVLVVAAR